MQEHVKQPENLTLLPAQELGTRGAEAHAILEKMKVELRARALPQIASALGVSAEKLAQPVHGPVQELLPRIVFDIVTVPFEPATWRTGTLRPVTSNDERLLKASPLVKSVEPLHNTLRVELDPASLNSIPKLGAEPLADGVRVAVGGVVDKDKFYPPKDPDKVTHPPE